MTGFRSFDDSTRVPNLLVDGLFETLCGKENYSNQVWSERRSWQWYRLWWDRDKNRYSAVDECDNYRNHRLWDKIWTEKMRCLSKMNPRLWAEWVLLNEDLSILQVDFWVQWAGIRSWRNWELKDLKTSRKRSVAEYSEDDAWVKFGWVKWSVECHLHKSGGSGYGGDYSTERGSVHDEK